MKTPPNLKSFYDPTKTYDANFDDGPTPVFDQDMAYKNHDDTEKLEQMWSNPRQVRCGIQN